MASPCNIYPAFQPQHYRHEDEHPSSYGRSTRLESASLESNRTDLSLNSRDVVVAETWLVLGKIGEGSFGEVFEVRDINTKRHYAIKRETKKIKHPQLKFENIMYDVLAGGVGIPQCHWYGQFDGFDCIVMDLLGPNLGQVRQNVSCMELDIAVDLVCQMVSIVEHIHNRGVVIRDVKPDNFLFPSNCYLPEMEMVESMDDDGMPLTTYKKSTCKQVFEEQWGESYPRLYAVDFGLACYWRDPETGAPYHDAAKKHHKSKTGTARYASINVHRGKSHSRRDDVESIGYILLDLLLGTLPWTGISARNSKMGWDRMRQLKVDTVLADLCAGLPEGVLKFAEYPRALQFFDQPDYERMRHYLKESLPGGTYSKLVTSPFGGQARPSDNYYVVQQELEELRQKQQQQQQQYLQPINDNHGKKEAPGNDHTGLFAMDDLTNQLAALTEPKPAHQQRKNSTASSFPLHKLPKRNRTKKIGWNTHKHDEAPWIPKTEWTNEEKSTTDNNQVVASWGDDGDDDQQPTAGNWSLAATSKGPQKTGDNNDDVDFGGWRNNHRPLDDDRQHVTQKQYNPATTTFSPRRSDPSGGSKYQKYGSQDNNHSSSPDMPFYRSTKQRHQPHRHHRRYSNPATPAQQQQQQQQPLQNTNRRRYHGVEGDQQQYGPTTDTYGYHHHRRASHHRNNTNRSLQEATGVDSLPKTIAWQQKESSGAK